MNKKRDVRSIPLASACRKNKAGGHGLSYLFAPCLACMQERDQAVNDLVSAAQEAVHSGQLADLIRALEHFGGEKPPLSKE